MKLSKRTSLIALSAVFALSALLPQAASAQNFIDPNDEEINQFLNSMGLEIGYPDLIWEDPDFIKFINKYQEFETNTDLLLETLINTFLGVFDFIKLANQIGDPRFDQFNLSEADLAEMEDVKNEILAEFEVLNSEKTGILDEFFGFGFADIFDDGYYDDYYYDDYTDYMYVYAWSDYYYDELPAPGTIVWLYSEVENPEGADEATVTWTQVDGPEVMWLNTDSTTDTAFIMPEYDSMEYDYLEFEVSADNGVDSDYDYVSFYIGEDFDEWDLPMPCRATEAACIFG